MLPTHPHKRHLNLLQAFQLQFQKTAQDQLEGKNLIVETPAPKEHPQAYRKQAISFSNGDFPIKC